MGGNYASLFSDIIVPSVSLLTDFIVASSYLINDEIRTASSVCIKEVYDSPVVGLSRLRDSCMVTSVGRLVLSRLLEISGIGRSVMRSPTPAR